MSIKHLWNALLFILASHLLVACTDLSQSPVKRQVAVNNQLVTDNEQMEETALPGKYLDNLIRKQDDLKNTLVIMDLDDTTITSPEGQWLGRSEMFYDLLKKEMNDAPGQSKKSIAETLDPLLIEVYWRVPVILTDKTIPQNIEKLKERGATVIGMTAKGSTLWDVTLDQLKQTHVQFSDISVPDGFEIGGNKRVVVKNGVVFVSHGNTKGEVVKALVNSELVQENLNAIVMIDDRMGNLDSVAEVIRRNYSKQVHYTPVLCTYPNSVRKYNSSEAVEQLEVFLANWQKDSVIASLIKTDPFTRKFLKQCASSSNSKQNKQCQALLLQKS